MFLDVKIPDGRADAQPRTRTAEVPCLDQVPLACPSGVWRLCATGTSQA